MRTLTFTAVLGVAAAALIGCGNLSFGTHEDDRSYTAPAGITALKIRSHGSPVEITGADAPGIRVDERLRWTNHNNKPKLRHVTEGNLLTLSAKCGSVVVGLNSGDCGVSYRIRVPRGTSVDVDNDGAVTASGLGGTVRLRASNGPLKVHDLRAASATLTASEGPVHVSGRAGAADLRSENGSINATGLTADRLTARSSEGGIRLAGRATVADVRSSNGSVSASGLTADRVTAQATEGRVDLSFATPPTDVRATSVNGSVHVRVPSGESYALDASASNGSERVDPAVHQDSRSDRRLRLRSSEGDVTVSPA